jgi:hypothetical protein
MKKIIWLMMVLVLVVSGCATNAPADTMSAASLQVSDGTVNKTYTVETLKALPETQASFKDVTYVGVKMTDLLTDAGFDPQAIKAVKAVASDGFTVNYDPSQFQREDVILAYQTADGALAAEDGNFRMVLPGEEGKLNARMVVEIQAVK